MYTPDLAGLREQLLSAGVKVSPIKHPEYMSSGEILIRDPDGYTIFVGHWGKTEQEAWEKRIGAKNSSADSHRINTSPGEIIRDVKERP